MSHTTQTRPRRGASLEMAVCSCLVDQSPLKDSVAQAELGGSTSTNAFNFNIGMNLPEEPKKVDVAIRIVFLITLLTVAPSLVMLTTCFTRIIIVFSFLAKRTFVAGSAGESDHDWLRAVYDVFHHAAGLQRD